MADTFKLNREGIVAADHVAMTRYAMDKKNLTNVERMADPNSAGNGCR